MIAHLKMLMFLAVIGATVFTINLTTMVVEYEKITVTDETVTADTFSGVKYSNNYCVIYNYWEAKKEYLEGPHITLVLHSTSNYLVYLENQLKTWTGGISVSVFIPKPIHQLNNTVDILENQLHLRSVFSALSSPEAMKFKESGQVSLHLFYKWNSEQCPQFIIPKDMYSISKTSLLDMKDFENIADIYPINAARNIARKGSKTKLFISGDIEQVYVKNFEPRMYELAKKVLLEFVMIS